MDEEDEIYRYIIHFNGMCRALEEMEGRIPEGEMSSIRKALDDIYRIVERHVSDAGVICPVCNGSGESKSGPVGFYVCERCGGSGIWP